MRWVLLAPFLGGTVLLIAVPALMTFALAFFEYDALSPPVWNGLGNFTEIFGERVFHIAVQNSFIFVVTAVPLRMLGAMALALLLERAAQGDRRLPGGGVPAHHRSRRRLRADLAVDLQSALWPAQSRARQLRHRGRGLAGQSRYRTRRHRLHVAVPDRRGLRAAARRPAPDSRRLLRGRPHRRRHAGAAASGTSPCR